MAAADFVRAGSPCRRSVTVASGPENYLLLEGQLQMCIAATTCCALLIVIVNSRHDLVLILGLWFTARKRLLDFGSDPCQRMHYEHIVDTNVEWLFDNGDMIQCCM